MKYVGQFLYDKVSCDSELIDFVINVLTYTLFQIDVLYKFKV